MSSQLLERDSQFGIIMGWHKLTKVREILVRDECFPDFRKVPLTYAGLDGNPVELPGWSAVVASDDGLSTSPVPTDTYKLFTPREAWDTLGEILAGSHYTVASAGTLKNRCRWFISVELDELKEASAGMADPHKFSLNFWGGLDRSLSPAINLSSTRIVCHNTLDINRGDKNSYLFTARLRPENFDLKLGDSKQELEKAVGMAAVYRKTLERMNNTKATVEDCRNAVAGFLVERGGSLAKSGGRNGSERSSKTANTVDEVVTLFQRGAGNKGETRADVLNGFTEYFTHGPADSKKDKWSQFEASEDGRFADFKSDFFGVCESNLAFAAMKKKGEAAFAAVA